MNLAIFDSAVQKFIRNYNGDTASLAFKGSPFEDVSIQELIQQIVGYQKTLKKLPSWHNTENIFFPPKLNIEQSSSEITAQYKASLVKGRSIADITGGMGVDCFYFAETFDKITHVEIDESLSQIAQYNFKQFRKDNVTCLSKNGLDLLKTKNYDTVYIDPARRHELKGKVFFLKDCAPNVPEYLETILSSNKQILLKTSPMLDIAVGLEELEHVIEIHVVAVQNEVKELLWLINKKPIDGLLIKTVNFTNKQVQEFQFSYGLEATVSYSTPEKYLYEPNAAILKAGAFQHISESFSLLKLHQHSHLYTSNELIDFPGRVFNILQCIPYNKKEMKKEFSFTKANITTRNFPETVKELRKKWKIKDGGDVYLFFTTTTNQERIVLVCNKLNK